MLRKGKVAKKESKFHNPLLFGFGIIILVNLPFYLTFI